MLEGLCHQANCFLTLTYTDESIPRLIGSPIGSGLATLKPEDLKNWLKRLRVAIQPYRLRFYAVGEYGDESERPHYHVVLFGVPGCRRGRTKRDHVNIPDPANCCPTCKMVSKTWGMGIVEVAELNVRSARYIAQYTIKKMTKEDDPRLKGRFPEFARMSRQNGGIGSEAMWEVADRLMHHGLDARDDVPNALRHGAAALPLGRYLMGKLRTRIGRDAKAPKATLDKMEEKMRPLREFAFENSLSFKTVVADAAAQPALNLETLAAIRKQRKVL